MSNARMANDNQQKHSRQDGRKHKGPGRRAVTAKAGAPDNLAGKLHHNLQLAVRAAKKAKTFEIQKLVRKIRQDQAKPASTSHAPRLREELEAVLLALKDLDTEDFAKRTLLSKLCKDRSGLADVPAVKTFCDGLSDDLPTSAVASTPASAAGKAQNKLSASKVWTECLTEIIGDVKSRAGIAGTGVKANRKGADTNAEPLKQNGRKKQGPSDRSQQRTLQTDSQDSDVHESDDRENGGSDATISHLSSADDDDDDGEMFEGIANSDGGSADSDAETGSEEAPTRVSRIKAASVTNTPAGRKASKAAPVTSAFLPSLAGGYTMGDSDGSVYSDSDDENPGNIVTERKNRRGQRARQAIWEKKYGKNANHVVKKRKAEAETEENRKRARAEREIEALKKSGRFVYGVDSNLTQLAEGKSARIWAKEPPPAGAADPPIKDVPKALHPSWEAKKKAKEAQAAISQAMKKPSGNKIRFD